MCIIFNLLRQNREELLESCSMVVRTKVLFRQMKNRSIKLCLS